MQPNVMQPNVAALARYRLSQGLSQADLAEKAGVSETAVNWLERGRRKTIRPGTAKKLAEALGVTIGDIAQLPELPDMETAAS